jgi:uncharacterized membrane protein
MQSVLPRHLGNGAMRGLPPLYFLLVTAWLIAAPKYKSFFSIVFVVRGLPVIGLV